MLLSIVIPCYRSAHTISKVVEMSMEVIDKIEGMDCEFVLVNDCSPDNTYEAIQALAEKYPNVKGIDLANISREWTMTCRPTRPRSLPLLRK